jgi:hypothetical protein
MKTRNMVFSSNILESKSKSKKEDKDALFDIKIGTITVGLLPCYAKKLSQLPYDNALNIVNFIMSLNTELNPSQNYRRDHIHVLCCLSKFYNNEKKFDSMTREDVLDFLDSYRKRALEHKNDNLVDISGIDWDIEEWEIE